ncbi:MAG: DUF1285 domain-containing protein [Proteobacteria bacterium]|nr:DUF1285 domain-containing protein [Pseudomonadota bacterium]
MGDVVRGHRIAVEPNADLPGLQRRRCVVDQLRRRHVVAVDVDFAGEGAAQTVTLRTNLDETVALGPAHPLRVTEMPDGARIPYVMIGRGLEARIARAPFYRLVERAVEAPGGGLGVWSQGAFFELGPAA